MPSRFAAPWYDLGCGGGDFEGGIQYIIDNGGVDLEDDYPYLGKDDSCKLRKQDKKVGPDFPTPCLSPLLGKGSSRKLGSSITAMPRYWGPK